MNKCDEMPEENPQTGIARCLEFVLIARLSSAVLNINVRTLPSVSHSEATSSRHSISFYIVLFLSPNCFFLIRY